MLLGEYEHALDDKNRLTLPAKLREHLGEELVVTRGLDGCLAVYSREAFESLAARIGMLDGFSPEARTMQRFFFTGAERGRARPPGSHRHSGPAARRGQGGPGAHDRRCL